MIWKVKNQCLDLTQQSVVMGILNATPDSFSDGGQHDAEVSALQHALQMIGDGAGIIDIGGESTRPGASVVDADEEMERVIPLICALRKKSDVLISIDTSKASVAAEALKAGADIVNDVTGLTGANSGQEMAEVCVEYGAGVVVMHMQGSPETMQQNPQYQNDGGVVADVLAFFHERYHTLSNYGIDPACLCFDPGIGFGKTLQHNLDLLRGLGRVQAQLTNPVLLGVSRKSMIGTLTGEDDSQNRDLATAAITALATAQGIRLHRVHDVLGNVHALKMARAMRV